MPDASPGESDLTGAGLVADRARPLLLWLRQAGQLVVGTGCLQNGSTTLALHTDYGPPAQDKETNQDYALAWSSGPRPGASEPVMALALADGVTSSYRSEWASELACAVALHKLVECLTRPPIIAQASDAPSDIARNAFAAAGRALQEVAQQLEVRPEASCPPGQFLSTWKYILRKGVLLQTTLTLAWLQKGLFRLAMVGDGGVLWRERRLDSTPQDEVLAEADLSTNEVHVLGPRTPEPGAFDLWMERPWTRSMVCAISSDGVGRGVQKAKLSLLNGLAELQAQDVANPAEAFIRQIVETGDPAFDDNLTLALLTRE
jgi:hypothetical protein